MIEATNLTKRYGSTTAVDDLTFSVKPGIVTGFLGPNGSGKSTTMRMILGLDRPDKGAVVIDGKPYQSLKWPLREVGALLEAKAMHPGRSARNHLLALAVSNKIARSRVDEVIELVGLSSVASRRAGGYSLGMGQRLGIAAALLGDPGVLLFDEPVNGLDPEGIQWVRELLRKLSKQGRTVFVSSHLMSEMAQTADHVIVIGRGHLLEDADIGTMIARAGTSVTVRSPDATKLSAALAAAGGAVLAEDDGALTVTNLDAAAIGDLAAREGLALHELSPQSASLEEAFMALTKDDVEFGGAR
ncbi:MAG TPA: ATP-binding cassette domain-containing protein [Acidimicrobiales bacterium]|jgi:ABC-2 type transport system ATP-binding protein